MTAPSDLVNRALLYIGDNQPPVTGSLPNFDNSTAGIAAGVLYTPCVQTVARMFGYDFSRRQAVLVLSGNPSPVEWGFEYLYPANGIEVRQILPPSIPRPNNPVPIRWTVGNMNVTGAPTKIIWTNQASAIASFTNQPPEGLWDAGFTEAVVRLLASELAMALSGKPETSKIMLESGQMFEQDAETRGG